MNIKKEKIEEKIRFILKLCNESINAFEISDNPILEAHCLMDYVENRGKIFRIIQFYPKFSVYSQRLRQFDEGIESKINQGIISHLISELIYSIKSSYKEMIVEYTRMLETYSQQNLIDNVDRKRELCDLSLRIIRVRDRFHLILEGLEEHRWCTNKELNQVNKELLKFDKRLRDEYVFLPSFKKYLDSYRESFGMKKGGKYWWLDIKTLDEVAAGELIPVFEKAHPVKRFYAPTKQCKQFDEHIIAGYVDRTLPEDLKRQFEKHLESCNYCLNQVLEVMQTKEVFSKANLLITTEFKKKIKKPLKAVKEEHKILQNLFAREKLGEIFFYGKTVSDAINLLRKSKVKILQISGPPGVGTSSAAHKIGWECIEKKIFNAIIWVSTKRKVLFTYQLEEINPSLTDYVSLIEKILEMLGRSDDLQLEFSQKEIRAKQLLKQVKTLLIIDEVDSLFDGERSEIMKFLKAALNPSKALITAIKPIMEVLENIKLKPLNYNQTLEFIRKMGKHKDSDYLKELPRREVEKIHKKTGGLPAFIKGITERISRGFTVDQAIKVTAIRRFPYMYDELYEKLSPDAKEVLKTIARFGQPPTIKDIEEFSKIYANEISIALTELRDFIDQEIAPNVKETVYRILPTVKEFAKKKLEEEEDTKEIREKFSRLRPQTLKKMSSSENQATAKEANISLLRRKYNSN